MVGMAYHEMGRVIEADMKITIWNFSQPLSDIAKQQIIEKLGNVTVYRIEVQLDLEKSIKLQKSADRR